MQCEETESSPGREALSSKFLCKGEKGVLPRAQLPSVAPRTDLLARWGLPYTPLVLYLPPHCLAHLLQVDTTLFAEFQAWRESPTLDKTSPFLERVYREDVGPCLDFTTQEVRQGRGRPVRRPSPRASRQPLTNPAHHPGLPQLSALVRAAVEDNTLTIEPVASQALPTVNVAAVKCGSTR